ncbi:MAG: hypothetical protein Q9169_007628 [Polycauliona sp. 2 TL-2023]
MMFDPIICLLLCLFTSWTTAESTTDANGTTYKTLALPNVLVRPADNSRYYCTTSPDWLTSAWDPRDCVGAIQQVQDIELVPKRATVYEYVEASAPQGSPSFYGQATPRKYVYNSCTLSIVMMNDTILDTYRKILPLYTDLITDRGSKVNFTKTDFTTYQDVCTVDQRINGTEQDTTIAKSLPQDWAYLGCNYGSSYDDSAFNKSWGGDNLSLERCAEYCGGLRYFGAKKGSECYCMDKTFYAYSATGGEMACNTTCNGNATQICGGEDALSVYRPWLNLLQIYRLQAHSMTTYRPSPQPIGGFSRASAVASNTTHMHRQSHTPPPPPTLSKRDKRRNAMIERLRDIEDGFASNRDFHYRQQLQALQRDANIITRATPYENQLLDELDDFSDVEEIAPPNGNRGHHQGGLMANGERQPKAGKWARGFTEQVNNAMEDRDTQLSLIVDRHNFRIRELKDDYEYAVTVADKEHTYLLNILRTRLTQTIEQKRAALLKERDKFEFSDVSSSLLNPTHFVFANPASPGGPQSNRKTRHGRHRYDIDDPSENKRKRKLPTDGDEGSPAPTNRNLDNEAPLVGKDSSMKFESHQSFATPPSMGLLFSDKELVITSQEASYAALQDILAKRKKSNKLQTLDKDSVRKIEAMTARLDRTQKPSKHSRLSKANGSTNPTTANVSDDDEDNPDMLPSQIDGADEALSDDNFLTAPAMDRTANSSIYATRSTRTLNPLFPNSNSPLQSLGDLAGRASAIKYMGTCNKERKLGPDEYQRAPALTDQEVEEDMALIAAAVREDKASPGKMNMKFVEDLGTEVVDYTNDGSCEGVSGRGSRESSETA